MFFFFSTSSCSFSIFFFAFSKSFFSFVFSNSCCWFLSWSSSNCATASANSFSNFVFNVIELSWSSSLFLSKSCSYCCRRWDWTRCTFSSNSAWYFAFISFLASLNTLLYFFSSSVFEFSISLSWFSFNAFISFFATLIWASTSSLSPDNCFSIVFIFTICSSSFWHFSSSNSCSFISESVCCSSSCWIRLFSSVVSQLCACFILFNWSSASNVTRSIASWHWVHCSFWTAATFPSNSSFCFSNSVSQSSSDLAIFSSMSFW